MESAGRKINLKDDVALAAMAEQSEITFGRLGDLLYQVFLNGTDVTHEIRSPQVTANVSIVSKVPAVRMALVKKQRAIRQTERTWLSRVEMWEPSSSRRGAQNLSDGFRKRASEKASQGARREGLRCAWNP